MRLLYITSLSGKRINGFMKSAIVAAKQSGYEFVMACNTTNSDQEQYKTDCKEYGISIKHIDFQRSPLNIYNIKAFIQLKKLLKEEYFDVVHCNTPIGGIIGRICSKYANVKTIIYQAHGFHFWDGAPIKNWLFYYPVEKYLSKFTDILITIAKDDFIQANKMHAKKVEYVHGVGIDLNKYRCSDFHNLEIKKKLGLPEEGKILLSVGELNKNKNHKIVIDALKKINDEIYYVICGEGELHNYYMSYIKENGLDKRVYLMGYRDDIDNFYKIADLFILPSKREGIPGAIMEAIATGIPVIASDIRGVRDIVPDKSYRFSPTDANQLANTIINILHSDNADNENKNYENLKPYSFDNVVNELERIYMNCII